MNQQMWRHPATQANARRLEERGVRLLGPASGEQACGEVGLGRMLEPAAIVEALISAPAAGNLTGKDLGHIAATETAPVTETAPATDHLAISRPTASPLAGRQVLVTAGPTREAIDPVRYIGNRSSGRMGYALAQALVGRGARVLLVSGPTALPAPAGVELVRVESALEMHEAVMGRIAGQDLFVATAAVADYRVADPAPTKIKKGQAELTLRLVRNPDILAAVAALPDAPFTVGFAAETERVVEQALDKLRAKGLDMIAANRVGGPQGGFEREDNALTVIHRDGRVDPLALMPKARLAEALTDLIEEAYAARSATQDS
jgi:phosphopantothenoylcysteine decarboxylase/phosphopantothenate--cysteine ligase